MIKLKLVLLNPGIYFIDGHAGIPKVSQTIHNKPIARGRAKGIHNIDFAFWESLGKLLCGRFCRIVYA